MNVGRVSCDNARAAGLCAPLANRCPRFHGGVADILLRVLQGLVALRVLFTGAQPPVRQAGWYARVAFHWPAMFGVMDAIASALPLRGAFRHKGERLRLYVGGTIMMLAAAIFT
jgi:hypothetical protein